MTTPNDNYTVAQNQVIYGGRAAPPVVLPAWAVNAPLNAWMEIPGTAGAGVTTIESFSGWAKLPNGRIGITLAGGHTDGTKNNTVVIDLLANTPTWVEVCPESPTHTYEVAYEADGKPTSCHTYYSTWWVPATNRLMRFGAVGVSLSGNTNFMTVDGIDLSVSPAKWDPAGTYANIATTGACYNPITGKILTMFGSYYYDPLTGVSTPITTNGAFLPRTPWVWDSTRNQMFGLCFGDNQGYNTAAGIVAAKIVGTSASVINIAASSAATQFIADMPASLGMDYDQINDCFLCYSGYAGTEGRVYKIKPNNTNTWDMTIFSYNTVGATIPTIMNSGMMSKFSYVPELKGVVMMVTKAANLYFMKLA